MRLALIIVILLPSFAFGATYQVGPTRTYTKPCQAIALLVNNDVVEIDGADANGNQIEYVDDICAVPTALNVATFKGVGAKRPHIRRSTTPLMGGSQQGIWRFWRSVNTGGGTAADYEANKDLGRTFTFENLEMSGAHNDTVNGQPLYIEWANVNFNNVYMHHNDNGYLGINENANGPDRKYSVTIMNSEFAYNGGLNMGANIGGQQHNIYIGETLHAHIEGSWIHDSVNGQDIKCRANTGTIIANRIGDSVAGKTIFSPTSQPTYTLTGNSNYEIDLSIGGIYHIIGNSIYQGAQTKNNMVFIWHHENPSHPNGANELYLINNTFVNGQASNPNEFIWMRYSTPSPLIVKNNIFAGPGQPFTATTSRTAFPTPADNLVQPTVASVGFVNALDLNFRLASGSSSINAGVDPGSGGGQSLTPVKHYNHPRIVGTRTNSGNIDYGAWEFGASTSSTIPAPSVWATSSAAAVVVGWTNTGSDVPITQYRVLRNGSALATVTNALTYSDTTATLGTIYDYTVIADTAGGSSPVSNVAKGGKTRQVTGTLTAALGWQEILNTNLDQVVTPDVNQNLVYYHPATTMDTTGNRLLIWNNGASWAGNAVYAFDFDTLTPVAVNANDSNLGTGSEITAGGRPNGRQTFQGVTWMPNLQRMFAYGGYRGSFFGDTWEWAPTTDTWTKKTPSGPSPGTTGVYPVSVYDPTSQKVVLWSPLCLSIYDPVTVSFSRPGACTTKTNANGTVDPTHNRFYVFGSRFAGYYNLTNGAFTSITGDSCIPLMSAYPGLAFDPNHDQIVGWIGGDRIYKLNTTTNTCTEQVVVGSPGFATAAGLYSIGGRFAYVPSIGAFVGMTETNQNFFVLRLDSPSAQSSFEARCNAPGVTQCFGFDSMVGTDRFTNNAGADIGQNVFPDTSGQVRITLDTTQKTSGTGSMRFLLPPPPHAGANIAGFFALNPTDNQSIAGVGQDFGAGETFYYSYRMRLDDEFLTNNWSRSTLFSQVYHWPNTNEAPSIVNQRYNTTNILVGGLNAGSIPLYTEADLQTHKTTGVPIFLQQGAQDCEYQEYSSCFNLQPNTWITFKYKVTLATFGATGHKIEGWYAMPGATDWTKFLNVSQGLTLTSVSGGGFDALQILPYMFLLGTNEGNPDTYSRMNIDELIVSTQDIDLPEQNSGQGGTDPEIARSQTGGGNSSGGGSAR